MRNNIYFSTHFCLNSNRSLVYKFLWSIDYKNFLQKFEEIYLIFLILFSFWRMRWKIYSTKKILKIIKPPQFLKERKRWRCSKCMLFIMWKLFTEIIWIISNSFPYIFEKFFLKKMLEMVPKIACHQLNYTVPPHPV